MGFLDSSHLPGGVLQAGSFWVLARQLNYSYVFLKSVNSSSEACSHIVDALILGMFCSTPFRILVVVLSKMSSVVLASWLSFNILGVFCRAMHLELGPGSAPKCHH